MSKPFDLLNVFEYVRMFHMFNATLVDGVPQNTAGVFAYQGLIDSRLEIEPRKRTEGNPDDGPVLDSLTRMVVFTSYQGVMDAAQLNIQLHMGRDTSAYVDIGPVLKVAEVTFATSVHVINNPLPSNFLHDPTGSTDIDDNLVTRMSVIPTANSSGDVKVMACVLLIPGATSGVQRRPRGAIYSVAGTDY